MAFGVIDQPVALAGQVTVNRMQGGPQLSRCREGFSRTRLTFEMMLDQVDAIDADPGVGGFTVPHRQRRRSTSPKSTAFAASRGGSSHDRAPAICFRC